MHGVIEPLSKLGITGEGEDSPQLREEVAGQVGKQKVAMTWTEETPKKTTTGSKKSLPKHPYMKK